MRACRELLQRDEAILRQLLQQELKKRESLKAAESKVAKLREQLQASEKIAGANRTLLKKLQEQVGVGFGFNLHVRFSFPDSLPPSPPPAGAARRTPGVREEDGGRPAGAGAGPGPADGREGTKTAGRRQPRAGEPSEPAWQHCRLTTFF